MFNRHRKPLLKRVMFLQQKKVVEEKKNLAK